MDLNQLSESTQQRVSWYIIPDHEHRRAGSLNRCGHVLDMLGKHSSLGKYIKALVEHQLDDRASLDEEDKRKGKGVQLFPPLVVPRAPR